MSGLAVNPAVRIEARLYAPGPDGERRTHFPLQVEGCAAGGQDVAAWLLTLVEFILHRQGRLAEPRRIGPPPGGDVLARLLAGAVVQAEQRPDGGTALRLNPGFQASLWLSARVPGEPARATHLVLADEPDVARWVLAGLVAGHRDGPPAGPLADALARLGLLVPALPPAAATLPDPAAPGEAADLVATAAAVIPQPAGTPVPAAVRDLLGRHVPPVPAGSDLAWTVDAGSGVVVPVAMKTAPAAGEAATPGPAAGHRASAWQAQLDAGRGSLAGQHHATVRDILTPAAREAFRHYVRQLVAGGYFPVLGDGQVERRAAIHNEPAIASLHRALAALVSRLAGTTVQASYCYLACYEAGAVLERHRDRPQCNYNLSLVFDMQSLPDGPEPEPWPIWLEVDGRPEAVLLRPGDGLVYQGTELDHWRDALPAGQRAIVCFFHFVPPDFAGSLD